MYLTQGLHRALQQRPNAVATICAGRTRTHAQSVDRIARLAAALRGLRLEDGDRAAILSLNSDRFHEFLGATLWAGGVVVPVNEGLAQRAVPPGLRDDRALARRHRAHPERPR